MEDLDDMLEDLKRKRDELRVQVHLASREVQDEWNELEEKMQEFSAKARLRQSGREIGTALEDLGHELKTGFKRVRDALRD